MGERRARPHGFWYAPLLEPEHGDDSKRLRLRVSTHAAVQRRLPWPSAVASPTTSSRSHRAWRPGQLESTVGRSCPWRRQHHCKPSPRTILYPSLLRASSWLYTPSALPSSSCIHFSCEPPLTPMHSPSLAVCPAIPPAPHTNMTNMALLRWLLAATQRVLVCIAPNMLHPYPPA